MRLLAILPFFALNLSLIAQAPAEEEGIASRLSGCWMVNDGAMQGQYCFRPDGIIVVSPKGNGRHDARGEWSVDAKGRVTITCADTKLRYVVERIADDGFVLVTAKEGIRLEGHRDQVKSGK
jgi:hypothetical protein